MGRALGAGGDRDWRRRGGGSGGGDLGFRDGRSCQGCSDAASDDDDDAADGVRCPLDSRLAPWRRRCHRCRSRCCCCCQRAVRMMSAARALSARRWYVACVDSSLSRSSAAACAADCARSCSERSSPVCARSRRSACAACSCVRSLSCCATLATSRARARESASSPSSVLTRCSALWRSVRSCSSALCSAACCSAHRASRLSIRPVASRTCSRSATHAASAETSSDIHARHTRSRSALVREYLSPRSVYFFTHRFLPRAPPRRPDARRISGFGEWPTHRGGRRRSRRSRRDAGE